MWAGGGLLVVLLLVGAYGLGRLAGAGNGGAGGSGGSTAAVASAPAGDEGAPTRLYAHNLLLRKGAHFRIYIRWIAGELDRTRKGVVPSFDAPESFVLEMKKGVISVKLADLTDFLNAGTGTGSPLKNISLQAAGDELTMRGTVHKVISLPVAVKGVMSPLPDGRVQFHVAGISVLKVPVKGLLRVFHVELDDLVASPKMAGVEIDGNDVRFDTAKLLPPPHIHGQITRVVTTPTALTIVYGGVGVSDDQLAQWHNFFRFEGGTLNFGSLTMRNVDLTMIDASKAPWFDLDLTNYEAQVESGYTRLTAGNAMEIYMPELADIKAKKPGKAVSLDWLKDRDLPLPGDVPIRDGKLVPAE